MTQNFAGAGVLFSRVLTVSTSDIPNRPRESIAARMETFGGAERCLALHLGHHIIGG